MAWVFHVGQCYGKMKVKLTWFLFKRIIRSLNTLEKLLLLLEWRSFSFDMETGPWHIQGMHSIFVLFVMLFNLPVSAVSVREFFLKNKGRSKELIHFKLSKTSFLSKKLFQKVVNRNGISKVFFLGNKNKEKKKKKKKSFWFSWAHFFWFVNLHHHWRKGEWADYVFGIYLILFSFKKRKRNKNIASLWSDSRGVPSHLMVHIISNTDGFRMEGSGRVLGCCVWKWKHMNEWP